MKKLAVAAPVAGVLLGVFRWFVITNCIDPNSGFIEKRGLAVLFSVLLIGFAAVPLVFKFLIGKTDGEKLQGYVRSREPLHVLSVLLAGGAMIYLGAAALIAPEKMHIPGQGWQLACSALAFLSGISFFLLSPAVFKKDACCDGGTALAPTLFSVLMLLVVFLEYAVLPNIMEHLCDYGVMILITFFFIAEAKLRIGNGDYRSACTYGISAMVMILAASLPRLMLSLTGGEYLVSFGPLDVCWLLILPYLFAQINAILKKVHTVSLENPEPSAK